jgi:glycine oxidase
MISDITIIGGGVIGLLTARECLLAGAKVTVIEKNQLGHESSWAGGGILLPLYPWRQAEAISTLVIQSLRLYPELAAELLAESGIDPEWNPCGMLITKNPDINAATAWCAKNNIPYESAGAAFFSQLQTTPEHPLWLPSIAQARNPRLVKSLRQYLINKGMVFHEHCQISDVMTSNNRITAINTSAGQLPVNQLMLSAGAWTGDLFKQLFAEFAETAPKVVPVKGQMLLFEATPQTLKHMVLDEDRYLIPRLDGKILAGSTVESNAFNKDITDIAKQQLGDFAMNLLPALKNYPVINHWAGIRPGTELGIPYIDRHPTLTNLFINAGHFRNGLAMGPASAQLMADLLFNRSPSVSAKAYSLFSSH